MFNWLGGPGKQGKAAAVQDGTEVDVFLSYARIDKERVAPFAQLLEAQGWTVFWDPQIAPGQRWDNLIKTRLDNARCIIVMWTAASVESQWVKDEASNGRDRQILVPVALDDTKPPLGFGMIQTASLGGWPKVADKAAEVEFVLAGVRRLLGEHAVPAPGEPEPILDLGAALGADGQVWMTIRDTEKPVLLETFIKQYPQSPYRPFAEALLGSLRPGTPAAIALPGGPADVTQPAAVDPAPVTPEPIAAGVTRSLKAGHSFRDHADAPEMVIVPAGRFEQGHALYYSEKPVRSVTIGKPFAVARYPVTFEQWMACVESGGSDFKPADEGWGGGRRPVINVTWTDCREFILWLNSITGFHYRFLSESEWEYCCRAGSQAAYATGESISIDRANFNYSKTLPVDSFPSNAFGLYDFHGNTWEWTADFWHSDYQGAPVDGSPWISGYHSEYSACRVIRGGSYGDDPVNIRCARRDYQALGNRKDNIGFRVARDLSDSELNALEYEPEDSPAG